MSFVRSIILASIPAVVSIALVSAWMGQPSGAVAADKLDVGSKAPKLDIEHWVQTGGGKLPKTTEFESGKVYVVEFWATWCGPCVQTMPHLAELQTLYGEKGLQIISISSEKLDVVEQFMDNEIADASGKKQKVSEITKAYSLTTDPDGSSEEAYMLAANQDGIPCAFIVGKDAKIEWIGHPGEMDEILASVLDGKWDRDAYVAEKKLIEEIQTTIGGLTRKKKFPEALAALDGFIAKAKDPRIQFGLYKSKIELQLSTSAVESDVIKTFEQLFASCAEEPLFVGDVAWTAYEKFSEKKIRSKQLIQTAIAAIQKVRDRVQGADQANLYDTLAHLQHSIGETKLAIESEIKAVKLSDESTKLEFQAYLDELQAAKGIKK